MFIGLQYFLNSLSVHLVTVRSRSPFSLLTTYIICTTLTSEDVTALTSQSSTELSYELKCHFPIYLKHTLCIRIEENLINHTGWIWISNKNFIFLKILVSGTHYWSRWASQTKFPTISRTYVFWCAMTSTFMWAMPQKSIPVAPIT